MAVSSQLVFMKLIRTWCFLLVIGMYVEINLAMNVEVAGAGRIRNHQGGTDGAHLIRTACRFLWILITYVATSTLEFRFLLLNHPHGVFNLFHTCSKTPCKLYSACISVAGKPRFWVKFGHAAAGRPYTSLCSKDSEQQPCERRPHPRGLPDLCSQLVPGTCRYGLRSIHHIKAKKDDRGMPLWQEQAECRCCGFPLIKLPADTAPGQGVVYSLATISSMSWKSWGTDKQGTLSAHLVTSVDAPMPCCKQDPSFYRTTSLCNWRIIWAYLRT